MSTHHHNIQGVIVAEEEKTTTAPVEKAEASKKPEPKAPQDRKPPKAKSKNEDRRKREAVAEFMTTGIDFTPFTIDAGDGVEWAFSPDPMPHQTEELRAAMNDLQDAQKDGHNLVETFDKLTEVIRSRLISDEDREKFPLPIYGVNALSFFAIHLATGRDGFPTEEA